MHPLRKLISKLAVHYKGYAALTGLAVDADDRLVLSSDIGWIDRKIWYFPPFLPSLLHGLHSFVNCILMRSGKCGKYQFTGIWMAHRYIHLAASFVYFFDLCYIFNIEFRIDSLGKHIVGNGQNIQISGSLPVSKQSSLHTIRSRKKCKLGCRNACTSVIMWVNT